MTGSDTIIGTKAATRGGFKFDLSCCTEYLRIRRLCFRLYAVPGTFEDVVPIARQQRRTVVQCRADEGILGISQILPLGNIPHRVPNTVLHKRALGLMLPVVATWPVKKRKVCRQQLPTILFTVSDIGSLTALGTSGGVFAQRK